MNLIVVEDKSANNIKNKTVFMTPQKPINDLNLSHFKKSKNKYLVAKTVEYQKENDDKARTTTLSTRENTVNLS